MSTRLSLALLCAAGAVLPLAAQERIDVDANWKFSSDNFNESYHLPTVHPELATTTDEDYRNTIFEMYPNGHNRMIEQGQPSLRSPRPHSIEAIRPEAGAEAVKVEGGGWVAQTVAAMVEAGIPVNMISMAISPATTPSTVAGLLAMSVAAMTAVQSNSVVTWLHDTLHLGPVLTVLFKSLGGAVFAATVVTAGALELDIRRDATVEASRARPPFRVRSLRWPETARASYRRNFPPSPSERR